MKYSLVKLGVTGTSGKLQVAVLDLKIMLKPCSIIKVLALLF